MSNPSKAFMGHDNPKRTLKDVLKDFQIEPEGDGVSEATMLLEEYLNVQPLISNHLAEKEYDPLRS